MCNKLTSYNVINSKYFNSFIRTKAFLAINSSKFSKASRANIFQSVSVTLRQAI